MTLARWLLAAALAALALPAGTAAAQTTYVMTCRGGGGMVAVAGQRVSQPQVFVEITFARAHQGAGTQAPGPGQCAWIDRGVGSNEPDKLIYTDTSVSWTQTRCTGGRCAVHTPSRGVTALMNAAASGGTFQVHAYNDRKGRFVVTRVGP